MRSKLITATILSLGVATGAFAQAAGGGNSNSGTLNSNPTAPDTGGDSNRMIDPNATNSTTGGSMGGSAPNDTRTNCAPNLRTQGSATTSDTTGNSSTSSGAGTNTNGQSTNC